ncbi:MAG: AI-2E family transporter [Firmicutes bacterium]|nr:AI-2E family transporter [Bacillota bacterium]
MSEHNQQHNTSSSQPESSQPDGEQAHEQQSSTSKLVSVIQRQDLSTPIYGLFTLAILYTLFIASDILLPLVFALLLSLLVSPAVAWCAKHLRMPRALSGLVLMLTVVAAIGGIGYGIFAPLTQWAEEAPEAVERILQGRGELQQDIEKLQESAEDIQSEVDGEVEGTEDPTVVVHESELWQHRVFAAAQSGVSRLALALALTYFLLVSGDTLVRNLAHQMGRSKRQIFLSIVRSGQEQVARYLGVITSVNVTIGIIVGLVSWGVGLPTPVLWGLIAALARFIPYVGGILGVGLLVVVSVATFDDLLMIAIVPGTFLLLISVVGFFLEPYIHGQRLAVNPVIIFISIFFWGFLWGPVGILLAVPLMTVIMVVVSHIPKLKPLSEVLRK